MAPSLYYYIFYLEVTKRNSFKDLVQFYVYLYFNYMYVGATHMCNAMEVKEKGSGSPGTGVNTNTWLLLIIWVL